uniref:WGS project CAEQ00000000 data, annotated contig 1818 n=1 Tax=Trypanosoma congolense (strain IL3000) TaxID=1068625 RepID=F9W953_TRYCI|nr:unnamed protein product [Trypanosoma congolense IL3000]
MLDEAKSAYKKVIETIEVATIAPDPSVPDIFAWRLRPSEEAIIAYNRSLNPPEPWGIKLNCSSMFWGADKCINIGRKLILNNNVTSLDISLCDMQEEGAVVFFSCLERNRCLRHLNVDGNFIGDRGAVAASKCIKNLETFHASCNNIHDAGAIALASSLLDSAVIKTLNLRGNRITAFGVYKLISALEPVFDTLPPALQVSISAEQEKYEAITEKLVPTHRKQLSSTELSSSRFDVDESLLLMKECDQIDEKPEERLNTTLHTLWIRQNDDIPEELFKILEKILQKRVPQLQKGLSKKKIPKINTA